MPGLLFSFLLSFILSFSLSPIYFPLPALFFIFLGLCGIVVLAGWLVRAGAVSGRVVVLDGATDERLSAPLLSAHYQHGSLSPPPLSFSLPLYFPLPLLEAGYSSVVLVYNSAPNRQVGPASHVT